MCWASAGSLWKDDGLLQGPLTASGRIFNGPNALREYKAYRGPGVIAAGGVPVETDGGAGTADAHWDDETFANELMTGYLSNSGNPLSRMTAASLIDLGYPGVNVDAADDYGHAGWNAAPYIYNFSSPQVAAPQNGTLTLAVANATDADGATLITKFYRESNGIPGLQATQIIAGSPRGSTVTPDTLVATVPNGVLSATFNVGNLALGDYVFYAQSYDVYAEPSGVVSKLITVIAPPPSAPSTPDLLNQLDTGDSNTDNITGSQYLRFDGTAEPGALVVLLSNGSVIALNYADSLGRYTFLTTIAQDGTYAIAASAINRAGASDTSPATLVTVDTSAPTVSSAYYDREVTQDVTAYVSEGCASRIDWRSVVLTNLTTGTSSYAVKGLSYSVDNSVADLDFASPLADGRYRITFPLGAVSDAAGNISSEYTLNFNHLNGDANGDNTVNFSDLLILARYYGTSGNPFSRGNFDYSYDGTVNFSDLLVLAQHYGATLPAAGAVAASVASALPAEHSQSCRRRGKTNRRRGGPRCARPIARVTDAVTFGVQRRIATRTVCVLVRTRVAPRYTARAVVTPRLALVSEILGGC